MAGGSKNVKVISDQFSSHFDQFGTIKIFFVNIFFVGGCKKFETNFRPIFSAFQPIWNNFDVFVEIIIIEQNTSRDERRSAVPKTLVILSKKALSFLSFLSLEMRYLG